MEIAINKAESSITQAGDSFAQHIYPEVKQDQLEDAAEDAESQCRRACEDLGRDIERGL